MTRVLTFIAFVSLASLLAGCVEPHYFGTNDLDFEDNFTFCPEQSERTARQRLGLGYASALDETRLLEIWSRNNISHREARSLHEFVCDDIASDTIARMYEVSFWRDHRNTLRTYFYVGIDDEGQVRSISEQVYLFHP